MHRSKILGGLALALLMLVALTGCPSIIATIVGSTESVQDAVDQAQAGDTIQVMGSHDEDVTVDKDNVTISGHSSGGRINGQVTVDGNNVTIENLTISGVLDTVPGSFQNLTLDNVTVEGWNTTVNGTFACADIVQSNETISDAVSSASSGDNLCIAPAAHTEDVTVDKKLSLLGIKGSKPTLDGSLTVNANGVTVDTLKVTGMLDTTPGFQNLTLTNATLYSSVQNMTLSCDTVVNAGGTIQTAITSHDDVCLGSGTFNEQLTISKSMTLTGFGPSAIGTVVEGSDSGVGLTVSASDVTVRGLRITNFVVGVNLNSTMSNLTFENISSVGNRQKGMELHNSANITNFTLIGVSFSGNKQDGVRMATESKVDGFTVRNSHFDNNGEGDAADSGIEVYQSSSNPGFLKNVLIENTTFNGNNGKGIYVEKLSDATFDNVTVDNIDSLTGTYGFMGGIDINLKYTNYQNITIKNSEIRNVAEGIPFNGDACFSAALAIKARDEPGHPNYGPDPATLDNVTIDNVTVADSFNGLRFGECGVDYSGPGAPNGPTSVTVTNSTFANNERAHVEDVAGSINLNDVLNNNSFTPAGTLNGDRIDPQ